jgi:RNA recognition motif-containing protein
VKAVYIKNLPADITQNRLRELFEHHGKITKVALPPAKAGQEKSRYGFVHFADRSSAMKALKNTEKYEIDGTFSIPFLILFFQSIFLNDSELLYMVNIKFSGMNRPNIGMLTR